MELLLELASTAAFIWACTQAPKIISYWTGKEENDQN